MKVLRTSGIFVASLFGLSMLTSAPIFAQDFSVQEKDIKVGAAGDVDG